VNRVTLTAAVVAMIGLGSGGVAQDTMPENKPCFQTVPYASSCDGRQLYAHPPCEECTDFFSYSESLNDITLATSGSTDSGLCTAECMVQRRRCGIPPGGTVNQCLGAGIYTYDTQTLCMTGDFCMAEQ